ncbi:HlyD family type I secretion periplasmic adaptor subunit [Alsobacter sp. KACC 23698]
MIGFGGFIAFSAAVPVASAVVAPGVVAAETDRKKVQHLEGGIIEGVFVQEGQAVQQGDVLFRLAPVQAETGANLLENQAASNKALLARLLAERDGLEAPDFSALDAGSKVMSQAIADQGRQFQERRASLAAQTATLGLRQKQATEEIDGRTRERAANAQQLALIETELLDAQKLFDLKLIVKSRVLALQREQARLIGEIGRADADIARAGSTVQEIQSQISELLQRYAEKVSEDLRTVRDQLNDIDVKRRNAADVLRRVDIKAPRTGVIQALGVTTIGEVIQPGAMLLEIAPTDEGILVNARIKPQDVDGIRVGLEAQLRMTALPHRTTPTLSGSIVSFSRDRIVERHGEEPYFLARVRLSEANVPAEVHGRVSPGMPVDVIVPTRERTLLSYLVEPLSDAFARAFRER